MQRNTYKFYMLSVRHHLAVHQLELVEEHVSLDIVVFNSSEYLFISKLLLSFCWVTGWHLDKLCSCQDGNN